MYIVISNPKRMSVATGFCHVFMFCLIDEFARFAAIIRWNQASQCGQNASISHNMAILAELRAQSRLYGFSDHQSPPDFDSSFGRVLCVAG
jgi:hypothetical protein